MPAKNPQAKKPQAKSNQAKITQAKNPSAKGTQAKDPPAKDPQAKDPQAKDSQAKGSQAKGPQAKKPQAKKPKHTAFTVAVSAADDGTSAPALRVYVAMATDPLAAVAIVQALMPEAAIELSGTLSDRLAARLKLKPGEVRPI
ncbi:hypothetical protein [Methylobacterium terricola]|uniref:hypothetical protein n=1 Tax=Methylobacterium terricola TaxID=2583531 RepID=UPI001FEB6B30|nr:hypothetical protein [Methylobacterium terricola]